MNNALAIAAQELRTRRFVLITAAVLALIPFALLLLPGAASHSAGTVVATSGGFVVLVYILGLSLVLGATFVNNDLTGKHLSFYFARPVPAAAIWFGKLGGALATIAIAAAVILIPAMLFVGEEWDTIWPHDTLYLLVAALALFLVSHAIATMVRSRSALIVADLIAAALTAAIVYAMYRTLQGGGADQLTSIAGWSLLAVLLAILACAGAWQLSRGRIEGKAHHRELSRFLWAAVAITLFIAGAALWWIVSVTPDDFTEAVYADQPPAGDWLLIGGPARNRLDYNAAFFLNIRNGAYQRLEDVDDVVGGFVARNGMAGQVRRSGDMRTLELLRFRERDVEVVPTNLTLPREASLIVSDDGSHVAVFGGNLVTVRTLPEGRTVAAARLSAAYIRGFFVTPDLLRIYAHERSGGYGIYEFDVRARRLARTGALGKPGEWISLTATPDGSRLIVRRSVANGHSDLFLADSRTGAVLGTLPPHNGHRLGTLLSDGRLAAFEYVKGGRALAIYGTDLALQRRIELPGIGGVWLLREQGDGKIFIGGFRGIDADREKASAWTIYAVDTKSGTIIRTERGLRPAISPFFSCYGSDPRSMTQAAGTPLVVFDTTGKLKRVSL
jgi:hypothetical protein